MMKPLLKHQRGFSLLVILLMMVAVSLLALGAMSSSVVQERMVGNARDHQVALQAAEAALRDAELDLENNIDVASGFAVGCSNGLCISPSNTNIANAPSSTPLWQTVNWANARAYGSVTGASALLGPDNTPLSAQPHYFIENLPALPPPVGESAGVGGGYSSSPVSLARAYRITVRASGIRASTVVMLQSVYVKQ
jgi:type IV pilus assembly protein PilX